MREAKQRYLRETVMQGSAWLWFGPLLYMLVVGIYFLVRFGGHWAETDSASFTYFIRVFAEHGRIIPVSKGVYSNGYAYQAISAIFLAITGMQVDVLQQWIYPLLAALVVLPAWILYREITGSGFGAAITTMLLFTQPEFLFVILRSSHEKFSRVLMMICLFLLARSFIVIGQTGKFPIYVILTYVAAYALISSNNLLANSFFLALAMASLLGWILAIFNPALKQYDYILKHLFFSSLVFFGLSVIFTYYIYPPSLHNLTVLADIKNRFVALFIDTNTQPTNAYKEVSTAWVNLPTYFLLSVANWIVLAVSLPIWLWKGWLWLFKTRVPKTEMVWLVWLLYAAFAIQGGLSALVDATGALSSNLQHRIFPSFAMIAVAMIGLAIVDWRPHRFKTTLSLGFAAVIFGISILSVFKATNEPLLSNKWNFYQPDEIVAMNWSDQHLQDTVIWTEFDERLNVVFETLYEGSNNQFTTSASPDVRNLLITDITRLRSSRINQPLPIPPDAFRVYDNGIAQLYRLRPQTPFQR